LAEILARGWANFLGRLDGPLHFRFIVQPLVAMILGARAGLRDARAGEPPFLWAVVRCPERRRERLTDAVRDVASVVIVAAVLDAAYQLAVHGGIFLFELLFTVAVLAIVPYVLVRGPVARGAAARRHAQV
jgi:hypothetical protein